ncbi:MAG: DUF3822 family protein [Daejeonella sp.]|uniref:DUF3822 family protein n=1 Tax=Daejeonella sp. TaxID=2805397 RepID=UPI002734728E|nr:DUF3822 family protein [Daejeonella sp.]MDP3469802.1 DUF3822 family protein [Daejeonella sp.]
MIKLLHLVDNSLQSQTAAKCDLLIHVGTGKLQYAIIDKVRDELKALAEYELPEMSNLADLMFAIEKLPETKKEFKYPFSKIRVSFDSYKYTFIPEELYENENEQEYAKFIKPLASDLILTNRIRTSKIRNVFAIDANFNSALNHIFQKPRIYSQATSFIEGIKKTNPDRNGICLFIDFHDDHIQIACLNKSDLVLYNKLECINADEFNYYLLNTIDLLALETTNTKVIMSGNVASENDEYYQRILKYFESPVYADGRLIVNHPEMFHKIRPHTYFSLLSLDECE